MSDTKSLAFIDVETTGCSPERDRIIEVGVVRVDNGTVTRTYDSLVNPGCYLPPEITMLTGIRPDELETAPSFSAVAGDVRELLDGALFVAHNARFDYSFIKSEFARLNHPFSSRMLCTVKLSRRLFPSEHRHNLDSIISRFGFSCDARHRALADARVLWDFYGVVRQRFGEEAVLSVTDELSHRTALPPAISPDVIDALPESDGVYIFYGQTGAPIYVGKSVNVRDRVLSHFYDYAHTNKERSIFHDITSIEAMPTEGELGALLLESKLIKKLQPILNRQLRMRSEMAALVVRKGEGTYDQGRIVGLSDIPLEDLPSVLAVASTKQQLKRRLTLIGRENRLCPKLLGLETGTGACFGSQVGLCDGACTGKELPARYNMRMAEAFAASRIRAWPFPGPVAVSEGECAHIVDRWCYLGEAGDLEGTGVWPEPVFEYDTYRILSSYILKHARNGQVRRIPYPKEIP